VDELERYLAEGANREGDFVLVARPTRPKGTAVASLKFTGDRPSGVPIPGASRYVTIAGRGLHVDEVGLSALGWTVIPGDSDAARWVFWRWEPRDYDAADFVADVRALAASVLAEKDLSITVSAAALTAQRNARRDEALEEVGFAFGMFFLAMPVSAAITAGVGVVLGIVSLLEATVAFVLTLVVVKSVIDTDRTIRRDRGSRLGGFLAALLVQGTAEVVAWLAPVPLLGRVATLIGMTLVLWFPIAVLAIVALVLRALPKV
jgi:hypothetical protein